MRGMSHQYYVCFNLTMLAYVIIDGLNWLAVAHSRIFPLLYFNEEIWREYNYQIIPSVIMVQVLKVVSFRYFDDYYLVPSAITGAGAKVF